MNEKQEKYSSLRNIIVQACAMEPSIKPENVEAGVAVIFGYGTIPSREADNRPVREKEAAKMLNVSTRSISRWGKMGLFRTVRVPGSKLILGYVREDIENFRMGRLTPTPPTTKGTGNRRSQRRKAA